ncbi:MAG TPA: hypothetical protein VFJ58_25175 [Armatimonadota bacterium]|nr:hypothetical protein [Armatimonadota bacterium]
MAQSYFRRLLGVRSEYGAAREALDLLLRSWDDLSFAPKNPITPADAKRALDNLDFTYFIRLHAEFESILRDEVSSKGGAPKAKVRQLESQALRARGIRPGSVNRALINRLEAIHRYRNSVAHGAAPGALVAFADALRDFNTFIVHLTP